MNSLLVKSKHIASSPRKLLLVAELVRNKEVTSSLQYLRNAPQKSSRIICEIIQSAYKQIINNNKTNPDFQTKSVFIELIKVDKGGIRKKLSFRAKGRADTLRQKKSHLTLLLSVR